MPRKNIQNRGVLLGVAGFSRSGPLRLLHQRTLLGHTDTGVTGVFMVEPDMPLFDAMDAQGGAYTLVTGSAERSEDVHSIGVVTRCVPAFEVEGFSAAVDAVAHPDTAYVAIVITEGQYRVSLEGNDAEAALRASSDDNPMSLRWLRLLADGLYERYTKGLPPIAVMPFDNVLRNGDAIRQLLRGAAEVRYAGSGDLEGFLAALDEAPIFNTVVDSVAVRTWPGTDAHAELRESLKGVTGVDDAAPQLCESYLRIVVENGGKVNDDNAPETPWSAMVKDDAMPEIVGAADVAPYADAKFCLLNSPHTAIGAVGAVLGITYVDELMSDDLLREFVVAFMREKQHLLPQEPPEYAEFVKDFAEHVPGRLSNVDVRDTCARLCKDFSSRIAEFNMPFDLKNVGGGHGMPCAAAGYVALRLLYRLDKDAKGQDMQRGEDDCNDEMLEKAQQDDPAAFLDCRFFREAQGSAGFRDAVCSAAAAIEEGNEYESLRQLLSSTVKSGAAK